MRIMQSHSLSPLKSIEYVDYINVYTDQDGKRHFSSEEFAIGDEGINSFDDALEEAYRFCVLDNWTYVKTLCDVTPCTRKMESRLGALANAANILRQFEYNPENYSIHDIEEVAREIINGDRKRA